jgi:prepilin peptidase CpaA
MALENRRKRLRMIGTSLLLGFLIAATLTDLRWGKIFNWTTYPGILTAVAASAAATWFGIDALAAEENMAEFWGLASVGDSLLGLAACGAAMLACYVSFPGGVGGGDVKLVAMIGAFLGLYPGLEAMLWTFVIGGCAALIVLVWRYGVFTLVRRSYEFLFYAWRAGPTATLSEEERQPLKTGLYLAPSAMLAVVIVRFHLVHWL